MSGIPEKSGQAVMLAGWVSVRRDHGKLVFLDVRDRSGSVQVVVLPQHTEAGDVARSLRSEWVVEICGKAFVMTSKQSTAIPGLFIPWAPESK